MTPLFRSLCIFSLCALLGACSSSIDLPKGTSKGYQSARLIAFNPDADVTDDAVAAAKEKKFHTSFQKALKHEFTSRKFDYGKPNAQLEVSYLVMIQNNAITFHYNDYFKPGPDADSIAEYAHKKGAVNSKRDEFFERAIILIDITDTQTGKLIFRNHYAKDIIDVPSQAERQKRIRIGISEALAPFFAS